MRAVLVVAVLGLAACGGGSTSAPPRTGPIDPTATPAGPDDAIVARVDGRPVYASCVVAQARAHRVDRAAALAQCVDFELLAGVATRRGLTADPEVAEAGRAAAAVRLVDREFSARYRTAADLPASVMDPVLAQHADRMDRPESRASWLVRLEIDAADRGTPLDAAAGEAIAMAYAQLGDRDDLFPADVEGAVRAAAAQSPVVAAALARPDTTTRIASVRPDPTQADFGLQPYYREALFAIPRIGMLAPPIRSPWGWDLILYLDFRDPPTLTRDQLAAQLFEPVRQRFFMAWSSGLAKNHEIVQLADEATLRRVWGAPAPPRRR